MSKKYSFLAKLLVMILCLALVFSGCGGASDDSGSEDETKPKTPEAQLSYSADKTFGSIFNTDPVVALFEDAMTKGKITIEAMGVLENVLYIDSANGYFADLLNADIEGEEIELSLYLDDTALAVVFPMLLGDEAYGVDLDTLEQDLPNSAIWDLLGVSYEDLLAQSDMDLGELTDSVVELLDSIGTLEKAVKEAAKDVKIESTEGKATIYGEEVDATVITVELTSNDVKKMLDAYMDWLDAELNGTFAEAVGSFLDGADLDSELDSMRDEIDDAFDEMDLTLKATVNIDPKTEYMMSLGVDLFGTVDGEEGYVDLDLILGKDPVSSDKYTFTMGAVADGEETGKLEAVLTRDLGETVSVTELSVTFTEDGQTDEVFSGKLEYNKESYAYELSLEADGGEVSVNGEFRLTDDVFDLYIDSVSSDGYEQTVDVRVCIESISAGEMPKMPRYKNLVTMSADELTALLQNVMYVFG